MPLEQDKGQGNCILVIEATTPVQLALFLKGLELLRRCCDDIEVAHEQNGGIALGRQNEQGWPVFVLDATSPGASALQKAMHKIGAAVYLLGLVVHRLKPDEGLGELAQAVKRF
jgi:hypothetical protein